MSGRAMAAIGANGRRAFLPGSRSPPATEQAIYGDRDGAELRFHADAEAVTSPTRSSSGAQDPSCSTAIVMSTEAVERPIGMVMYNCPDGDVTGDDLVPARSGRAWSIASDGGRDRQSAAGRRPAAAKILLPGLGPAIRHSSAWGEGKARSPWDCSDFKGCE